MTEFVEVSANGVIQVLRIAESAILVYFLNEAFGLSFEAQGLLKRKGLE
jgi:hypothetical protein